MSISNSNFDKRRIKNKITLCDKNDHNNIKGIFKKYNHTKYTKNKNGYFINLDSVPRNVLKEIEDYIDQSIHEKKTKYNAINIIDNYDNYDITAPDGNLEDIETCENKTINYNINNEEEIDDEEILKESFEKDELIQKDTIMLSQNKDDYDYDIDLETENDNIDNIDTDDNDDKSIYDVKLSYPNAINEIIKKCRDVLKKSNNDSEFLYTNYKENDDDDEGDELSEDNDFNLF